MRIVRPKHKFRGERIKCWKASAVAADPAPPGQLLAAGRAGIDIACGEGVLRMLQLQRPGRNRVSASEFAQRLPPAGADVR